jgi:hypothetical protein
MSETFGSSMDEFISEAAKHATSVRGQAAGGFCAVWPGIRQALEDLRKYLPFWAAWAIDLLEKIGDHACPQHTAKK